MDEIYTKTRAKINLNLEILGKRSDGYHELQSVFQKINLYDELWIQKTDGKDIEIQSNKPELNNSENILYKAYQKLKENHKEITGVRVKLKKRIPMQAGLAGGSTDCASFLLSMNRLFNLKLDKEELEQIGKSLGADVVACFYNQAVRAEGIGELITPIDTHFHYYIIVIKPDLSCNTKKMYQKIDQQKEVKIVNDTDKIIHALEQEEIEEITKYMHNVFEDVIEPKHEIETLKKELLVQGAQGALMTGSGSCVYGIFTNKKIAKIAYRELKKNHEVYWCTSYNTRKGLTI